LPLLHRPFPANYDLEFLPDAPGDGRPIALIPPDHRGDWSGSTVVELAPADGTAWLARFVGAGSLGAWTTPDPHRVLVAAAGAWLVDSRSPGAPVKEVVWPECRAQSVLPVVSRRLLIVLGPQDAIVIGESGVQWSAQGLVHDGFESVGVGDRTLFGVGAVRGEEFEVDLETRVVRGGTRVGRRGGG
jgi:hypothetical protein